MGRGGVDVLDAIDLSTTDVVVDALAAAPSTLELVSDSTATLGSLTLSSGILTVNGPAAGTIFTSVSVDDGADTGLIASNPVSWTGGNLTVDNTNPGANPNQNFTLGGTFTLPGTLTVNNNAKITAAAGTVTAETLALQTGVPTANTFALGEDGTLIANAYHDGGQTRVITLEQDGTATNGTLQFGNPGVAGTVVANNTTFNVGTGATLEAVDSDGNPLGAAGAQMLNLDGGTALFSRGATGVLTMQNTPVTVSASSTLDAVTDGDAGFGALVFAAPAALTTTGAVGPISFNGTTLAAGNNEFNTVSTTDPGAITVLGTDAAVLVKTGAGDLVLDDGDPDLTGGGTLDFDVQAGRLIGISSSAPFGPGDIDINGGEVVLVGTGPASSVTYTNSFEAIGAGGTLTAGLVGSGTGGSTITVDDLTPTAGTLTLQTVDLNTMVLSNGLTGAPGTIVEIAGDVQADTVFSVDTLIMSGGTITPVAAGTLTGITVDSALSLTGGDLDLVASGLTLDTTANTVVSITNGNTLTLNQATLGAIHPLAGLTVNNATMVGEATKTTVKLGATAALNNATLIDIIFAGAGGISVNTSPDEDGVVDLGGATHTYSGETVIHYGALAVDAPANLSASSNLKLDADDAEVPAILLSEGTFNRDIGTAAGDVQWSDNGGGFAAKGAGLAVDIGTGAALVWGDNTAAGGLDGKTLQLSHGTATAMVDFQNAIELGADDRTVFVADNPASNGDIARISGDLTTTGGALKKTGAGTVDITGAATALTATNIENGAVRIADGSFAKLGTISLLGNTNIDDDAGIAANPDIGVIETSRAGVLFVNPTGAGAGTDLDITFQNSSVGISNSSVTPLMVSINGDNTVENETTARARTITWNGDLNNKRIVMGSATAQGTTELINLLDLATSWDADNYVFEVADNPSIDTDKAIVNILTTDGTAGVPLVSQPIQGIRKVGAGELVVNTRDETGAFATLIINNNEFEIDGGTVTVAADSTIEFSGQNDKIIRIEDGAVFKNLGEIIIKPGDGNNREVRNTGIGDLRNEGTFTFDNGNPGDGDVYVYEWDNNPDTAAGGRFIQAAGGVVNVVAGTRGGFRTENANDIGSGVVIESGANITIDGADKDLFFQRQVGLDMKAATTLLKAANGSEIFLDNGTQFSAGAGATLLADGAGARIYIRNTDTNASNPDGAAFTMQGINGGQVQIGGQWTNATAVLVGDAFIGENFYSGAADTQINFDVAASSTPDWLVWKEGHIYVRDGHTMTFQNDVSYESTNGDWTLETQGTGQIVLPNGKTLAQNGTREFRINDATNDTLSDFVNHGTVTWNSGGRIDIQNYGIFENATDGVITVNAAGSNGQIGREGDGQRQILNKGLILADDAKTLTFSDGNNVQTIVLTDVGQAASGGSASIEARNGAVIRMQMNINFATDTLLKTTNGGVIELGGYIEGAELNGTIDGDVFIDETLRSNAAAQTINMNVANSPTPGWLVQRNGTIVAENGDTLTTNNDISYEGTGNYGIDGNGTGTFVIANGYNLVLNNISGMYTISGENNDMTKVAVSNHGTIRLNANRRMGFNSSGQLVNEEDGLLTGAGQFDRENHDFNRIVNKGHVLADGETLTFASSHSGNSYLLFEDVGQDASSGNALIEATNGGVVRFRGNIDFAADTKFQTSTGGTIEIGGYMQPAGLFGEVNGDARIAGEYLRTRQNSVIDMDVANASTPGWLTMSGWINVRDGHTLTTMTDIIFKGSDVGIDSDGTGVFVIPNGVTLLQDSANSEMRILGQNNDITKVSVSNHGTIRLNDTTRIAFASTGVLVNEEDGLITGSGTFERENNDHNRVVNKGRILADGGTLNFNSQSTGNSYVLLQDVGQAASSGNAVIEAANSGAINIQGNIDFAADTLFYAHDGGHINIGGTIQTGVTGVYGIVEGNARLHGEQLRTKANAVIDMDVTQSSTPGYLVWETSNLEARNGHTITHNTNISYQGSDRNLIATGTGVHVISHGVTLRHDSGNEMRMGGSSALGVLNHGIIEFNSSGSSRIALYTNDMVVENASDGLVLVTSGKSGYFERDNNDRLQFLNKGHILADGGSLRFQSAQVHSSSSQYLEFEDVGLAASGGTALIEAKNGGTVRFNGQFTSATDTLFRAGSGGQIELGGTMMYDAAAGGGLYGVIDGNVVLGELLDSDHTTLGYVIDLDAAKSARPGYLVWEDGAQVRARAGSGVTLKTNLSYQGSDDYIYGYNGKAFIVDEGATFAIDTTNEVRINDGSNKPAAYEFINNGTILFNPANGLMQGGRIALQNNTQTGFQNSLTGLIRSTATTGIIERENNNNYPTFDNLGTLEVESSATNAAFLEVDRLLTFPQYTVGTKTLNGGTYRVLAVDNNAELKLEGIEWEIQNNGIAIIGAAAKVVLSETNEYAGDALFRWLNTDGNVIDTVEGELYVHGFASVDMASTVDGGVLGGDGTVNVAGTLDVKNGATLDPGKLDADNTSAGGTLTINGSVNIDDPTPGIEYAYQPGDKIVIDGDLTHTTATPVHEVILYNGATSYSDLTGTDIEIITATGGTTTGLWTVSADVNFGGDDLYFTADAGTNWDSASWSKDGLSGITGTEASYNGNNLELDLSSITEGAVVTAMSATDNVRVDAGVAVTSGAAVADTVNSLTIADTGSVTLAGTDSLTVTTDVNLLGTLTTGGATVGADGIDIGTTGQLNTSGATTVTVAERGTIDVAGGMDVLAGTTTAYRVNIAATGQVDVSGTLNTDWMDVANVLNVNAGGKADAAGTIDVSATGSVAVAGTGLLEANELRVFDGGDVTGTLTGAVTVHNVLQLDGSLSTGAGGLVTAGKILVDGTTGSLTSGDVDAGELHLSAAAPGLAGATLNVLEYHLADTTLGAIADAAGATYAGATSVFVEGGTVTLGAMTNTGTTRIEGGAQLNTPSLDEAASQLIFKNGTLHDTDGGTITRTIGKTAGGVLFQGAAGFSADADLDITLTDLEEVNPGDPVSWRTDFANQALTMGAAGTAGKITMTNGIILSNGGDNQLVVNDSTPTVDAELSGILSGGADSTKLVKSGDGTLKLSGANTYVSDTEVLAGTLLVDDNSNLGDASSKTIIHGGATLSGISWSSGVRTVELIPGSAVTIDAQAGSAAMALALEADAVSHADIVKTGAGTASIAGGLALTGQIDVNEGTLGIGANLLAAPGGTATIADGTTLEASGIIYRSVATGNGGGNDVGTGLLQATGDLTLIDFGGNHFQGVLDIGANTGTVIGPGSDPDVMLNKVLMAGGGSLGSNLQMRFRDHQSTLTGPPPGWVINAGIVITGGGTAYLNGNVIFGEGPGGGVDIQVAPGTALIVDGVVDGAPNELPPFAGGGGTVTYTGWKRFGWSPTHSQRGAINYAGEGKETVEIYGEADWTSSDAYPGSDTEPYDSYDRTTSWGAVVLPGNSDGVRWEIDFVGWTPDGSGDEVFEIVSGNTEPWWGNHAYDGSIDNSNGVGKDNFSMLDSIPAGVEWEVLVTEGSGGNMSLRFFTAGGGNTSVVKIGGGAFTTPAGTDSDTWARNFGNIMQGATIQTAVSLKETGGEATDYTSIASDPSVQSSFGSDDLAASGTNAGTVGLDTSALGAAGGTLTIHNTQNAADGDSVFTLSGNVMAATFETELTVGIVQDGGSYAGIHSPSGGGMNSMMELLGGANEHSDEEVITTKWSTPVGTEFDGFGREVLFASDVVDLKGISNDIFVLQISYDETLLPGDDLILAAAGTLYIIRKDDTGVWQHAADHNGDAEPDGTFFLGAWNDAGGADSTTTLGDWGVDTGANVAWVVTDHNSEFAVPEPGTMVLLAMGGIGILMRRRRRRS